jgi:Uncharacterized protein conserved in bacteria (DUF2188)
VIQGYTHVGEDISTHIRGTPVLKLIVLVVRLFDSGKAMPMSSAHIIPSGARWNVKQENGDVISTHDTQAEAEQAAKEWARAHGGGEVFTHRDEGEFSRIRKGDAV